MKNSGEVRWNRFHIPNVKPKYLIGRIAHQ